MDLKNQILVALGLNKDEDVNMAYQAKSEDGTIFVSTADELAEGVDISVLTEDGTTILLPIGTYTADGVTFTVEVEGVVSAITETEEVVEEVEEEEMTEELEVEDDAFERLVEKVQNLEDAIADLKADKVEATEEVEELAEEVEVEEQRGTTPKSIKTTEVVEFSIEDLQAENERLKTELAAQPAAAPLNTSKFSEAKLKLSKKQIKGMTSQDRFLYNLNN